MTENEKIKRFVRETLGCGCPEEVFRDIECLRQVRLGPDIVLRSAITVGSRLLIYVAEAGAEDMPDGILGLLLSAGRRERDRRGLNRFRLVLLMDENSPIRDGIERTFDGLKGRDDRLHLHVVDKRRGDPRF